jgi:fucose permease
MKGRTRWTLAILVFVAVDAVSLQIRGALLPSIGEAFDVGEGALGLVAPAGTVGFLIAVLAVGMVAGRVPIKLSLVGGVACGALFLAGMAVAPSYWPFLLLLFVHGAALGVFRGLDRVLLSHLYPNRRGSAFNLHSLAWAVGAVSGPALVALLLPRADWQVVFGLVALGFLPVLVLLWGLSVPESVRNERPLSLAAVPDLLRTRSVFGMSLALLFVGGVEGAVFTWLPYYAATSLPPATAALALSAYLLAYVPGRIAYTTLADRVAYRPLLLVISTLAVPASYVAFVVAEGYLLLLSVFVLGLFVSGLFPTLSAVGVDAVPEYSGPASAISTAATYVGIAVVPLVLGLVAERESIGVAMGIPVVLLGAVTLVVAWLWIVGPE